MKLFQHGPSRKIIVAGLPLAWPVIKAAKKWSKLPVFKWLISPFFMRPYNEITTLPIGVEVEIPKSVAMPSSLLKRLLTDVEETFLFNKCLCRGYMKAKNEDIGCMALGPAAGRIHPSHGRMVTKEEAFRHVDRAAKAGYVANFAHVWIDPVAFGTRFHDLMYICYCDNVNCVYTTYMKKRGSTLDGCYQRLPGLSISVEKDKCNGCGNCAAQCFLGEISIINQKAAISDKCAGCGRCVESCPSKAISLDIKGEDEVYGNLVKWIKGISDLPIKNA